jgi:hypothetical protein
MIIIKIGHGKNLNRIFIAAPIMAGDDNLNSEIRRKIKKYPVSAKAWLLFKMFDFSPHSYVK